MWCKQRSLLFSCNSVLEDHEARPSPCIEKLHSLSLYRGTPGEMIQWGVEVLCTSLFRLGGKFLGPCFNGISDIVSSPCPIVNVFFFFIKRRCLARRGEQEWLCYHLRLNSDFAQLSPWLNSAWNTCQLYGAADFCWSIGSQLERHFDLIDSCFAKEKEEKYLPVRCYCSVGVLQMWNYHSDTSKPLLNILEKEAKPWGWKLDIFPLLSLIDPHWVCFFFLNWTMPYIRWALVWIVSDSAS